ncbi:MAG: DNA repair protein RadC, partial [Methanimicrococcus sp.]|nr:DNA repair protein RadC [Methanimicrococcus sp.]
MIKTDIKLKDLPHNERPREKLMKMGPESLSEAELLANILQTGTHGMNVVVLCQRIFAEMSLKKLSRRSVSELTKIPGIGPTKACQIVSLFELSRRLETYTEGPKFKIKTPEDIYQFIYPKIREEKKEKFIILCLDSKHQVIFEQIVFIGSLDISIVHPREIFKTALLESAAAIILVHNHPSGDPTPSKEDIEITKRLVDSGKLIGISILDHIIIGDGNFISLKQ